MNESGFHKVRIESIDSTSEKIFLDGKELRGVTAADIHLQAGCIPTLNLKIMATDIDVVCDAAVTQNITYSQDILNKGIEYMNLSVRSFNAIVRGMPKDGPRSWDNRDRNETIGDVLIAYQDGRLKNYRMMGKQSYAEVVAKLKELGLTGGGEHG